MQNCGDVLTKKKLDAHRGQCRGASFTCLDCMIHFHGTEYKSHTVRLERFLQLRELAQSTNTVALLNSNWLWARKISLTLLAGLVMYLRGTKIPRRFVQGETGQAKEIRQDI